MKRRSFLKYLAFAGGCLLLPLPLGRRSKTITCDPEDPLADFARLQDAIDWAQDGDTILVSGTHMEQITIPGINLTIEGKRANSITGINASLDANLHLNRLNLGHLAKC